MDEWELQRFKEICSATEKWSSSDLMELSEFISNPENSQTDLELLLTIAKTKCNDKERHFLVDAVKRKIKDHDRQLTSKESTHK